MTRIFIHNNPTGDDGFWIDGWEAPPAIVKIIRKQEATARLRKSFGQRGDVGYDASELKRIHSLVVEYAKGRWNGSMPRLPLDEFCTGQGYTTEMMKPILQRFIRKDSEADGMLFDVSVWS